MELDKIKQRVLESGISVEAFQKKVDEYRSLHSMFKANAEAAYTCAAADFDIKVPTGGRASTITEDQIQKESEYLNVKDIDSTPLRVINLRGFVIRAPQSEDDIKKTVKLNDVIYLSMVDITGQVLLSCYKTEMFENIFDEKLKFLDTISLKNILINTRKSDGAKFLNITERTIVGPHAKIDFGAVELYSVPVAEITERYSTCLAVLSQKEESTYVGCPVCRKGGFDVEVGETVYCPSDNCKNQQTLEELMITNVGLMDKSGAISCGISKWATINLEDFEIGSMVYASVNAWGEDDNINYSITELKDISDEAYGEESFKSPTEKEKFIPDPEDFVELKKLFEFENTEEYEDTGIQGIDKVISIYYDICEFYDNVTPRDLSSIYTRRLQKQTKIGPAFLEMLKTGIIKFDRIKKEVSPLETSN